MPIVQTGRSRGFISTESPEPGYLVVCLCLDLFRSAGRLRIVPPPLAILWHLPFTDRQHCPRWPPEAPLRLYIPLGIETPNQEVVFAEPPLFRRRRFQIGSAWRSCPST